MKSHGIDLHGLNLSQMTLGRGVSLTFVADILRRDLDARGLGIYPKSLVKHNSEKKPQSQETATTTLISRTIKPYATVEPMVSRQPMKPEVRQKEVELTDYKNTAIWQESMKRLGAKAAREIQVPNVKMGNTPAQKAAFEQGRKDARAILNRQA